MLAVDERQARELAARLLAAYPATAAAPQTTTLYDRYLRDLPFAETEVVVDELIATSVALPTVADVRRRVIGDGLALPTALEAYASLSARGAERHPLTLRAASYFGGSYNVVNAENPSVARAQFLKAYEELREEELRRANVASFRGRRSA
jgi:hypothetical protein